MTLTPSQIQDPDGRRAVRRWPELLDTERYHSVLYVGANERQFHLYRLCKHDRHLTVLEAYEPYCDALEASSRWTPDAIICGNVSSVCLPAAPYDLVVWWRGPEHVLRGTFERLAAPGGRLDQLSSGAILLGSPYGVLEQEPIDGNVHQSHKWTTYPGTYKRFGYETVTRGRRDTRGSYISAFRYAVDNSQLSTGK